MSCLDEIKTMTLKSLKKIFSNSLNEHYSQDEIDTIFYVLIEFYLGINKINYIQDPLYILSKKNISLIESKIKERNKARDDKNYELADKIRNELLEKGVQIEDKDGKTSWKFK